MWDLKDINEKKRYVLERLKTCKDVEEKEKLEATYIAYINLLNHSGSIRYTRFYNFMDRITKDKFTLIKNNKYHKMVQSVYVNRDFLDNDYIEFLVKLATTCLESLKLQDDSDDFTELTALDDELIEISRDFYNSLGDVEIKRLANKILNDEKRLNFTNNARIYFENFAGLTNYDYIFNKVYCTILRKNTIFDFEALNHEVMHGIDLYTKVKLPSKNYEGFHEIPTYTIDYLFIDYLENKGFQKDEILKLRVEKNLYLASIATITLYQIKRLILENNFQNKLKKDNSIPVNDIIIENLLHIQSSVIAYGLYEQIKKDKQLGFANLKKIMKTIILKDKKPDFSFIGLSDEKLLELASKMEIFSKGYCKTKL